jgi:hypothetical protein
MPRAIWLVVVPQMANPRPDAVDTAPLADGCVGVKLAAVLVVVTPALHAFCAAREPTPNASITGNNGELGTVSSASSIVMVSMQHHPILHTFDAAMLAERVGKIGVAAAREVVVVACVLNPTLTANEIATLACRDSEVAAKVTPLGMVRATVGNQARSADHEATAAPLECLGVPK